MYLKQFNELSCRSRPLADPSIQSSSTTNFCMLRSHAAERQHGGEIRTDLCGFVVARHPRHGLLLLQANKAKKGGLHYQLPGGHVNREELVALGPEVAAKVAACRELYEETGIDVRRETGRLQKVDVGGGSKRSFFVMDLRDSDATGTANALLGPDGHHIAFRLQISDEHTGFVFEQSLEEAARMVQRFRGGLPSRGTHFSNQKRKTFKKMIPV